MFSESAFNHLHSYTPSTFKHPEVRTETDVVLLPITVEEAQSSKTEKRREKNVGGGK